MSTKQCPACQGQISPQAAACPHCGHPLKTQRRGSGAGAILLLVLLLGFGLVATNWPDDAPPTTSDQAQAEAERVAAEHAARQAEVAAAIRQRQVIVGMTREEVRRSWGRPRTINTQGGAYGATEQWVYDSAFLYFEGDSLTSWQTTR